MHFIKWEYNFLTNRYFSVWVLWKKCENQRVNIGETLYGESLISYCLVLTHRLMEGHACMQSLGAERNTWLVIYIVIVALYHKMKEYFLLNFWLDSMKSNFNLDQKSLHSLYLCILTLVFKLTYLFTLTRHKYVKSMYYFSGATFKPNVLMQNLVM